MSRAMVRSVLLAAPALLLSPLAEAAVPACAVSNKGYMDPDVSVVNGGIEINDALTCQQTCQSLPTCQVFTFYINSGGCWLQGIKGKALEVQDIPGTWSGPKDCGNSTAGAVEEMLEASPEVAADSSKASGTTMVGHPAARTIGDSIFVALALIFSGVGVAYWAYGGCDSKKKKASKTTRGAALEATAAEKSIDLEASAPLVSAAAPVPVPTASFSYAPMPVTTSVVPAYTVVAPPVMAPPVVSVAAPVTTATRVVTMPAAEPVISQGQDIFDRLDANHDGVLSREEFNQVAGQK